MKQLLILFALALSLSGCAAGIGHGTTTDVRQPVAESGPNIGDAYERQSPGSRR